LLIQFFQWYAPYFSAYTFVLARANEYEADSWSARVTGSTIAEQALGQLQIHLRLLEESFWPEMMRLACTREHPDIGVFHRLGEKLKQETDLHSAQKWLRQALAAETSNADTHPCLRDRLGAMGRAGADECNVSVPPATAAVERADLLLGDTLAACVRALEIRWENGVKTEWRQRYLQAKKERERLQAFATKENAGALTADEIVERAQIILNLEGDTAALPFLRRALELAPGHAQANFLLGRILIQDDDKTGVGHLEQAIGQEPDVVIAGLDLLYLYYRRLGLPERMREMEKRYDENIDNLRFAHAERKHVNLSDTFLPHRLTAAQTEDILVQLREYREIQRAYLVRKEVSFFPQKPLYVLMVELLALTVSNEPAAVERAFVNRLAENLRLPGETIIFTPIGRLEPVGRIIRLERWTRFYEKSNRQSAA
jgi:TPR repeat protein